MSQVDESEVQAIIGDATKSIDSDLVWSEDEDHGPRIEFRAELSSAAGHSLMVVASYNRESRVLGYHIVHRGLGRRIYGLDLGRQHRNPDGHRVGETHKHRWTDAAQDRWAYAPSDITASADDPVAVWRQFCAEASINHRGTLQAVPWTQQGLF